MNKILLLDLDGVISKGKLFSEIYSEEFGVDTEVMMPFFKEKKGLTNTGKADLKELLEDELEAWEWEGSVDELVDYWLRSDSNLDEDFIEIVKGLEGKGVDVYLATDQEKYRTEFMWNEKGLKEWMRGRFVSYEVGYEKKKPEFFKFVSEKLGVDPAEIIFFDDSQSKVDAAKAAGINAFLFTDNKSFKEKIEELF